MDKTRLNWCKRYLSIALKSKLECLECSCTSRERCPHILSMADSSFGIGILGAAAIAKKNARAIAKCRNGTGTCIDLIVAPDVTDVTRHPGFNVSKLFSCCCCIAAATCHAPSGLVGRLVFAVRPHAQTWRHKGSPEPLTSYLPCSGGCCWQSHP